MRLGSESVADYFNCEVCAVARILLIEVKDAVDSDVTTEDAVIVDVVITTAKCGI